jgi:hypothetical protein
VGSELKGNPFLGQHSVIDGSNTLFDGHKKSSWEFERIVNALKQRRNHIQKTKYNYTDDCFVRYMMYVANSL